MVNLITKIIFFNYFNSIMGGGVMQLVAYGAQDSYLTGNPQITFFKVVYRRYTNFSIECLEQHFIGSKDFGKTVTANIARTGDLINRMYIEHTINMADNTEICANYGSALLKQIDFEIGGQRIDRHYGHWLEVWSELTHKNPLGIVCAPTNNKRSEALSGTQFQVMSGMGGVTNTASNSPTPEKMYIPLQFWFCKNYGSSLPIIALQYHEVKVKITIESLDNLIHTDTTQPAMGQFSLWVDYVYLDTEERRRFAEVDHEYLIDQLQYDISNNQNTELHFNQPIKELIWTEQPNSSVEQVDNAGPSTPLEINSDNTFKLEFNGHERIKPRPREYFTRTQIYQHHTGYGGLINKDSIAVYSFSFNPEENQPSGTCNFSRLDSVNLVATGTINTLNIYAVNYNILRIIDGTGGLAFSN